MFALTGLNCNPSPYRQSLMKTKVRHIATLFNMILFFDDFLLKHMCLFQLSFSSGVSVIDDNIFNKNYIRPLQQRLNLPLLLTFRMVSIIFLIY